MDDERARLWVGHLETERLDGWAGLTELTRAVKLDALKVCKKVSLKGR